jgi:hypothetical protein
MEKNKVMLEISRMPDTEIKITSIKKDALLLKE